MMDTDQTLQNCRFIHDEAHFISANHKTKGNCLLIGKQHFSLTSARA